MVVWEDDVEAAVNVLSLSASLTVGAAVLTLWAVVGEVLVLGV